MKTEKEKANLPENTFLLTSDRDLVAIRDYGRKLALEMGFSGKDQTLISTALSEICRNVIEYAGNGEVTIEKGKLREKDCIRITVTDHGPGIEDVKKALEEGFSTGRGLGVGLPGAKRIMDEFDIHTCRGEGTTVRMCKWLVRNDEY